MGIPVFQRTFLVRTSVAHTVCRWLSYLTWPTVKGRGFPILPKTETIGDRAKRKRTRMGAWIILFISHRRLCDRFLRFFWIQPLLPLISSSVFSSWFREPFERRLRADNQSLRLSSDSRPRPPAGSCGRCFGSIMMVMEKLVLGLSFP